MVLYKTIGMESEKKKRRKELLYHLQATVGLTFERWVLLVTVLGEVFRKKSVCVFSKWGIR